MVFPEHVPGFSVCLPVYAQDGEGGVCVCVCVFPAAMKAREWLQGVVGRET